MATNYNAPDYASAALLYGRNPYAPTALPTTFAPAGLLGGQATGGGFGGGGFGGGGLLGGGGGASPNSALGGGGGMMNAQSLALAGKGLGMLGGYGKSLFGLGGSGLANNSGSWVNPDTGALWNSGVWQNPDTGELLGVGGMWQNPDLYGGFFSSGADAGLGDAAGSVDWGSLFSAVG